MPSNRFHRLFWPVSLLVLFGVALAGSVLQVIDEPRSVHEWFHVVLFLWACGLQVQKLRQYYHRKNHNPTP